MIHKNITGIILAGGKSTRMGENKSLLEINGKKIILIIKELLENIFEDVIIISDNCFDYNFLNIPVYPDIFKDKGPLSGIHSGLMNSRNEKNFIISCDMPLVSLELINYITEYRTEKDIIITSVKSYIQPLCGIYAKSILSKMDRLLSDEQTGNYSIHRLLDSTDSEIIEISDKEFYNENIFFNINNKEDYNNIKSILSL